MNKIRVYAIVSATALKIGMTTNMELRLSDLQSANSHSLRVVAILDCENADDAFSLEAMLHRYFQSNRLSGEWFNITPDDFLRVAELIRDSSQLQHVAISAEQPRVRLTKHTRITHRSAKDIVRAWLNEHPEDITAQVRELAVRLDVGKSTVSDVQREFKRGD